jgi:hypothetical protein
MLALQPEVIDLLCDLATPGVAQQDEGRTGKQGLLRVYVGRHQNIFFFTDA